MGSIEATCDLCGRVYAAKRRRHYCDHCNRFFYVCHSCEEHGAKCRLCGIPLKHRGEPVEK